MNNGRFEIKQGDLEPGFAYEVIPADLDLSGATAVFRMASRVDNSVLIERAAVILETLPGKLGFTWQTGDTDISGEYNAEFRLTFPGDRPLTIPSCGAIRVSICRSV